jgi:hypothetical protein
LQGRLKRGTLAVGAPELRTHRGEEHAGMGVHGLRSRGRMRRAQQGLCPSKLGVAGEEIARRRCRASARDGGLQSRDDGVDGERERGLCWPMENAAAAAS